MRFFAYDPFNGLEVFSNQEDAIKQASEWRGEWMIEGINSKHATERAGKICVGIVTHQMVCNDGECVIAPVEGE